MMCYILFIVKLQQQVRALLSLQCSPRLQDADAAAAAQALGELERCDVSHGQNSL